MTGGHRSLGLLMLLLISAPVFAASPDWTPFARVLDRHVHVDGGSTWVDYRALRSDPDFTRSVLLIGDTRIPDTASRDERLAFYINAYNILTMKVVADNWPVDSIRDVGNLLQPVWKMPAGRVGGRTVSLDDIEHGVIRPLGDPRIHFAIVCASRSCPDLRREPYTALRLSSQLDDQVRRFLADPRKGLDVRLGAVRASRIFAWFEEDFAKAGGPLPFIRRYRPDVPEGRQFQPDLVYDWSVNGPPTVRSGG